MSKNLTRKGLAFGALVALTSSVVAGSPALAAGEINVVPSAGTSYNTIAGAQFTLSTTFAPGFAPAAYSQLKYLVKTDANSTVKFAAQNTVTGLATAVSGASAQAVSTTSAAVAGAATAATDVSYLGLSAVTTTATSAVEVTAFVDANNDGALTSGEWNTVRTVNFKKAADIVPAVTLTAPATGDTSLKATVAWGDLNIEQLSDETVKFTAGSQIGTATAGTLASGVWSLSATALAASEAVTAQAYIGTTALGSAASAVASARTISDTVGLVSNVLKGNDSLATAATTMVANTAATVRTNGSFTAQVKAFDRATTPAAKSGVSVSASATTSATLRPASTGVTEISVTFNGTKYTTNATLNAAVAALTTDASGLASVAVSSFGLVDGQTVTVTFAAQNLSSAVVATQRDAVYTVSDDAASTIVATNKNAAASFNYSIKDQFGVLSARTNERLVVSATAASGTAPATQYIAVSGGKAAFSVTPTTDNTADVTVIADLEVSTNTNGTITWAANGTDVANRVIKVRAAAYSFSVAPAVALYNNAAPSTTVVSQPLTASALADLAAPSVSNATWAKVTLTGTNAGEKLTASAAGTFLSIDGAAVTADSATKVAQGTVVEIFVASNTTGTKTLTISNGSVTSTVSVVFSKAVETSGTVIELTAPANAGPGTSFVVSGVVKDKFGNVVDTTTGSTSTLSVTYEGPGIVVPASGSITETNASGAFSFRVILGANETGTGVVTATYDADGAGTTAAVVATKTINAAVVASSAASGSTGKFFASATNAAGKKVVVKVDGKFAKSFIGTAAKKVISVAAAKGTKTITIFVGGKLSSTKVVIVK